MSGLRLEIDLDKVGDNARTLVARAAARGVSVTGITKAMLGEPALARTMLAAGVAGLGDSRIENVERMRQAHVASPMLLIRSPMPSQIDRVVRAGITSVNSEVEVLTALADAARRCGRVHDVMIMVELGDLRDGVMPERLNDTVRHVRRLPSLRLAALGGNLACRSGIVPTDDNMGALTRLVLGVESAFDIEIGMVSGGNSANLAWLAGTGHVGRIDNLRLGESMLLGTDPLDRRPIEGLHSDAFVLVGEVVESIRKPTQPWGRSAQHAFGEPAAPESEPRGHIWQTIVAMGRQDVDATDLQSIDGARVLAASSDHLLLATPSRMRPGDVMRFRPGYSALLRSMTSPFVAKTFTDSARARTTISVSSRRLTGPPAHATRIPTLTIVPRTPVGRSECVSTAE